MGEEEKKEFVERKKKKSLEEDMGEKVINELEKYERIERE